MVDALRDTCPVCGEGEHPSIGTLGGVPIVVCPLLGTAPYAALGTAVFVEPDGPRVVANEEAV